MTIAVHESRCRSTRIVTARSDRAGPPAVSVGRRAVPGGRARSDDRRRNRAEPNPFRCPGGSGAADDRRRDRGAPDLSWHACSRSTVGFGARRDDLGARLSARAHRDRHDARGSCASAVIGGGACAGECSAERPDAREGETARDLVLVRAVDDRLPGLQRAVPATELVRGPARALAEPTLGRATRAPHRRRHDVAGRPTRLGREQRVDAPRDAAVREERRLLVAQHRQHDRARQCVAVRGRSTGNGQGVEVPEGAEHVVRQRVAGTGPQDVRQVECLRSEGAEACGTEVDARRVEGVGRRAVGWLVAVRARADPDRGRGAHEQGAAGADHLVVEP